jgi:hypothetical protein
VPFDMMPDGDPFGPICNACKRLIGNQPAKWIEFASDPRGDRGLTGDYHAACSRPFEALARVINLRPFGSF